MAEHLRKTGIGRKRRWGSPVLSTDPLLQPLSTIADAIRAGEQAARRTDNTEVPLLQNRYREAFRRIDVLPYILLIGDSMTMPNVSFRLIASRLEEERGMQKFQEVGIPRQREGDLIGDDGSEMRFQMEYNVIDLRGKPFIIPMKYEQNLRAYEGLARLASGGGHYGEYAVSFKEGEIDQVETNIIPCSSDHDANSSTDKFLKRFLNGENVGYFYLNFSNLTTDPTLNIQMQKGMQRRRLCEYKFGDTVDYHEDTMEAHTSASNVEPGELNFDTFLVMLEESVDLVPTI